MRIPAGSNVGGASGQATLDGSSCKVVVALLAGLERQKEELGPIADELLDLLHHLGAGKPPPQGRRFNPSSE